MAEDPLVPVEGVDCPCEGRPHPDGDTVYLYAKLPYRGGMIAEREMWDLSQKPTDAQGGRSASTAALELEALLMETYVLYGVADWTFVDEAGEKLPVTDEAIRRLLLSDFLRAKPIGDKGDDLYTEGIFRPLAERVSRFYQRTRTTRSTSPRKGSSGKPRRPRKRSSTTTTVKAPPSA